MIHAFTTDWLQGGGDPNEALYADTALSAALMEVRELIERGEAHEQAKAQFEGLPVGASREFTLGQSAALIELAAWMRYSILRDERAKRKA